MYEITYDNTSLSTFHTYMADCSKHDGPRRNVTSKKVPGRNGELTLDNGCFENYEYTINAYTDASPLENLQSLKGFLLSVPGYRRLEDSMHPNTFLMARFHGPFTVKSSDRSGAILDLRFDCMPQRFLTSGEAWVSCSNNGYLVNPTYFTAKPLIRVYGTGNLYVGSYAITINTMYGTYTDIDCESMEAFYGSVSCNQLITLQGNSFPVLLPGQNGIHWTGSISRVDIMPRWWEV